MNKLKKRKPILLCLLSGLIVVLIVFAVLCSYNTHSREVQKLYNYGEYIEKMDIPPNAVVAKFNGEEILFQEVESYRRSINHSIKDGHSESIGDSAFYDVLRNKLYAQTAINQKNASNYNLNVQQNFEKAESEWVNGTYEEQLEWLEALCIERDEIWLSEDDFVKYLQKRNIDNMLVTKGMYIIMDTIFENPDLVSDKRLVSKFKKYTKTRQDESALTFFAFFGKRMELYNEIEDAYVEELILASDLELCVEEGILSVATPIIKY